MHPKRNGLNLLRLVLASGVILYHAFRLSGTQIPDGRVEQALENIWVDGFFVVSGFLITGSRIRRPHVRAYLRNRLLRLYPAFFVCLIVTAFVLAPLGVAMTGEHLTFADQGRYVVVNLGLHIVEYDIGGTPATVPWPDAWNGSLWTLFWEFLCYLAILAAGVTGLLRRRWGIPLIATASLLLVWATSLTRLGDVSVPLGLYRIGSLGLDDASRFAVTFAAGALIYHLQDRLVCSWKWVALAAAGVAAAMWLPDYRLVAAPLLAYALIAAGALMRREWMVLRTDISYGVYIYAFPIQQILACAGWHRYGVAAYALAALAITLVLAYASWRLVEKPALAHKAT